MWVRIECLRMLCWMLSVPVGSVEKESPKSDVNIRKDTVVGSLLDREAITANESPSLCYAKHEGTVLTAGGILCSALLQVYESFFLVKKADTRLFRDLVLSGLCLLLATSHSAKLLALQSEYVMFIE